VALVADRHNLAERADDAERMISQYEGSIQAASYQSPTPAFRILTPAPPPFSEMNSTPAASSAACIAARVAGMGAARPCSKRRTVASPTFAAFGYVHEFWPTCADQSWPTLR
jgi:hypothetical protein